MSLIKVLHVYRTYFPDPPGGLQEAIRQICLSTQHFGIENWLFTLSPNPHPKIIKYNEATVVRCRSWVSPASCDLGGIDAFKTFRDLSRQADIIHYLFPWPFADILRLFAGYDKPKVLTYISDIVRQRWLVVPYKFLMWSTLRSVDAIVANSQVYLATSQILSDSTIRHKLRFIPLGILEEAYPKIADDSILRRLGIEKGEPFFLFIGVLRYYKGLHTLIESAKLVKAKVVIAGSGPEGQSLQALAKAYKVSNVIFAGSVTDSQKVALLKDCLALVLPSHLRSEAYGMVLVEASMFGKPMISCEIGTGTSFVNLKGETGFVVPPEEPTTLASAMNQLLEDTSISEEFGRRARLRYEQLFSGETLGRAYSSLYREILQGRR